MYINPVWHRSDTFISFMFIHIFTRCERGATMIMPRPCPSGSKSIWNFMWVHWFFQNLEGESWSLIKGSPSCFNVTFKVMPNRVKWKQSLWTCLHFARSLFGVSNRGRSPISSWCWHSFKVGIVDNWLDPLFGNRSFPSQFYNK